MFSGGIWAFHFGYDNNAYPSMEKAAQLIENTGEGGREGEGGRGKRERERERGREGGGGGGREGERERERERE